MQIPFWGRSLLYTPIFMRKGKTSDHNHTRHVVRKRKKERKNEQSSVSEYAQDGRKEGV